MPFTDEQLSLLASLPSHIASHLSEDDQIAAVWLGGSLGRGEGDWLSDIDVVVVCQPDRSQEVALMFPAALPSIGSVALIHEAPQNAPLDGRQLNVLYNTAPLPLYVDWNIWPAVSARPIDVAVLFEREPVQPSPTATFESMLADFPPGAGLDSEGDARDHFRVFMTPIFVKYAARAWFESVDQILSYLGVSDHPVRTLAAAIDVAHRVLRDYGGSESGEALSCIRRYLRLVGEVVSNR